MSGATTWLHGQRKTELVELADKVGLKDYDSLKKADLETALDEHMRTNQSRLAKDGQFHEYYRRISASPGLGKKESTGKELAVTETKTPKRRTTKTKEDDAKPTSTSTGSSLRSPASSLLATEVPLPPSPAVIASHIERNTARARAEFRRLYARSGASGHLDALRARLASPGTFETLALLTELVPLRGELLPLRYLYTVPASPALGTGEIPIKLPDMFALVRADFYAVFFAWAVTSLLLPLLAAYLLNFAVRKGGAHRSHKQDLPYDMLVFNVAKGLITYLVYGQNCDLFGWPSYESKLKIEKHVPGGYQGVLIASGIGSLFALYDAALKK